MKGAIDQGRPLPPKAGNTPGRQRQALYTFGDYNPYYPSEEERSLVAENFKRLQGKQISLRSFIRQTPHVPRWRHKHLHQARVLLVTNEEKLTGIDRVYGAIPVGVGPAEVAKQFHLAMSSWLSMTNHPHLRAIYGEEPWVENGAWEGEYPHLAAFGKAGYFLAPGEENQLAGCKVLHLTLSPFAQSSGLDVNPRNDQDVEYHRENLRTVRRFCDLAAAGEPRYLFIISNRASIRQTGEGSFRLEAARTPSKDRSRKIADLLREAQSGTGPVQVRICRHWPSQGRNVEVFEVVRPAAFELRMVSRERI